MVGKYRSRRKQLKRHKPKGGIILDGDGAARIEATVNSSVQDVGLVGGSVAHGGARLALKQAHEQIRRNFQPQLRQFQMKFPDRSVDLGRLARGIFEKHVAVKMPKVGGGIDISKGLQHLDKLNPVSSINKGIHHYDKLNFDRMKTPRDFGRAALRAWAGSFNIQSGIAKAQAAGMTASVVAAPAAFPIEATGVGLGYIGDGFGMLADSL